MGSLLQHLGDTGQDISKPGARINAVELCGLDQAVRSGGAFPTLVGAAKELSLSPQRGTAQHPLGGATRQADAPIIEEPGESFPALQHVVRGLGEVIVARELCPLGTHPCRKRGYQLRDVAITYRKPLRSRLVIDRGFCLEHRSNLAHGLDGQQRLMKRGQLEQFAPARVIVWSLVHWKASSSELTGFHVASTNRPANRHP
jgi:hypothetical protein